MIQHARNHHPVHKAIQSSFKGLEEGLKIYGTLRSAWEVGKGMLAAGRSAYQVAAPIAAELL